MPIEKSPKVPLLANYIPSGGVAYKVKDDESWVSIAKKLGVDVWGLIEFNFKTRNPEVNWYLRYRVGCRKMTAEGPFYPGGLDRRPLSTLILRHSGNQEPDHGSDRSYQG